MLDYKRIKNLHDLNADLAKYDKISITVDQAISTIAVDAPELAEALTAEVIEQERIAEISKTAIRSNYSADSISKIVTDVIVQTLSQSVDSVDVSIDNAEFLSAITADAQLITHKLDKHIMRHFELDSMTDTLSASQLKTYDASTHQRIHTRCLALVESQQTIDMSTHFLRDITLPQTLIEEMRQKARENNQKEDAHSIHHTIDYLKHNNRLSDSLMRHFKRKDVKSSRAQYIIDFDYSQSSDFSSAVELLAQLEVDINSASDFLESAERILEIPVLLNLSINIDSRFNKDYRASLA